MKRTRLVPFIVGLLTVMITAQEIVPPLLLDEQRAFDRAIRLERLQQFEEAEEIYRALLKRNPRNSRAYLQLRSLYKKLGKSTELESLIVNHLMFFPDDLQSHAELGELYYDRDERERASEQWDAILERNPRSRIAYRILMQSFLRHQLYGKLDTLVAMGRMRFNDPSLFSTDLGLIYRRNHEWGKAADEYVTFAIYHPRQTRVASSQLLRMSDDVESQPSIEATLVKRIPESETIVRQLYCDFLFKTGRYNDAYQQHLTLGTEEDKDLDRWLRFADNLRKEGKLPLALDAFTTVLRNIPQEKQHRRLTGQALYGLALTYEEQILPSDAFPSLGEYFPNNVFFQSDFYTGHSVRTEPLEETFSLYDSILVSLPSSTFSPQAHFRLGEIKYRITGDYHGALESFRSANSLSKDPELVRSSDFRICDVLMAKGEFEDALSYIHNRIPNATPTGEKNRYTLKKCQILFLIGQVDSTLAHLNALISHLDIADHQLNDALELRGFIQENYLKGGTTAKEVFRDYLEGERLLRQGKAVEARSVFRSVEDFHIDTPIADYATFRRGWLDLFLDDHDGALSAFASLRDSPLGDRATVMIGEIYEHYIHDTEEAIRWYYTVLEEHPGSMLAEPVRFHIRQIKKSAVPD